MVEDVHDNVTRIHEHPLPLGQALDTQKFQLLLVEGFLNVLGDGLHVSGRAAAQNDEVIGEARHLRDLKDHRFFSLVSHPHVGAQPCDL